jgi:hypothetical protein
MLRVEVELKLMLDVEERTHDAAQAAFVQYLGEVGPHHVAEGLSLTGYAENSDGVID